MIIWEIFNNYYARVAAIDSLSVMIVFSLTGTRNYNILLIVGKLK